MGEGSSIAQNCSLLGENAGIFVGKNVMIAPNVVFVAFNHGYLDTEPMVFQKILNRLSLLKMMFGSHLIVPLDVVSKSGRGQ